MIPPFIAKIFAGKAKEIAGTVIGGLDNLFTSKEERIKAEGEIEKAVHDHIEKMEGLAIEEMKIELDAEKARLADIANARDQNIAIQNSDKASWLSKNVAYIIDLFVFAVWGAMTIYIICRFLNIIKAQAGVDFSGILGIYSGITAIAMTVLNFHRGSSVGSEKKQKHMERMEAKKT